MATEDVAQALEAMADEGVRRQLSEGDYSALGGLALSEEERALVAGAAADYPDVEGFELHPVERVAALAELEPFPRFAAAMRYVSRQAVVGELQPCV